MIRRLSLLILSASALGACDGLTTGASPGDEGRVTVALSAGASGATLSRGGAAGAASLAIEGTNGTLVLEELRLVVAEFEMDGEDDGRTCTGDDCEDLQAGPMFVNVPLGSGAVDVASALVPAGTYRQLEFEVEDLDDDDEDPAERARIEALRREIAAAVPDWPHDASMLAAGTFHPRGGGSAVPFRVFAQAEIEVELDLVPPLVVAGGAEREVPVRLDLAAIFRRPDGSVLDLSSHDVARMGRLLRLEVELGGGFRAERWR